MSTDVILATALSLPLAAVLWPFFDEALNNEILGIATHFRRQSHSRHSANSTVLLSHCSYSRLWSTLFATAPIGFVWQPLHQCVGVTLSWNCCWHLAHVDRLKARVSQISSFEMTPSKAGIPLLKSAIPLAANAPFPPSFVYSNNSPLSWCQVCPVASCGGAGSTPSVLDDLQFGWPSSFAPWQDAQLFV